MVCVTSSCFAGNKQIKWTAHSYDPVLNINSMRLKCYMFIHTFGSQRNLCCESASLLRLVLINGFGLKWFSYESRMALMSQPVVLRLVMRNSRMTNFFITAATCRSSFLAALLFTGLVLFSAVEFIQWWRTRCGINAVLPFNRVTNSSSRILRSIVNQW